MLLLPSSPHVLVDLVVAFLLVYLTRAFYRYLCFRSALRAIDGPPPTSWLWGNDWDLYVSPPGELFVQWADRYGGVFRSHGVFGAQLVSFTDPGAIDHIFDVHKYYNYPKPAGVRAWFELLLGRGVIWAEGESHTHQRKTLGPAFNQQALRDLTHIFFESAYKASARWNDLIERAQGSTAEIDVQYWANRMSLDSIGLAGFSYDFNTLSDAPERVPLAAALDLLTDSSGAPRFPTFLVKTLMFAFPAVLRFPSARVDRMREARRLLGEITGRMWRESKAAGEETSGGKTVLEILMRADHAMNEHHMTEDEISAEMMTLIFAGYETTSCIIAWALHELALDPSAQEQLRAELSASPSDPTFDTLARGLPYLDAVVQETLRLHPPVLDPHRVAVADDWVPLSAPLPDAAATTRVFIPRGTVLNVPINVIQCDPRVWGADAQTWRPSRWAEVRAEREARDGVGGAAQHVWRKELVAFGVGTCIGRSFAILEIKAALSTLVRQFAFEPAPGKKIEPFVSFVVRPRVKGEYTSTLPLVVRKVNG